MRPFIRTLKHDRDQNWLARSSTDKQDLTAQRQALYALEVSEELIFTDHRLTGTNRTLHGFDQVLAAVREGDVLIVSKLDRLARSVPDARYRRVT